MLIAFNSGNCLSEIFRSQFVFPLWVPRTKNLPTAGGPSPSPPHPLCCFSFLSARTSREPSPAAHLPKRLTERARTSRGRGGMGQEGGAESLAPLLVSHEKNTNCVHGVCSWIFFFCELHLRGVEESTRCTDRGWLSCLWDDVHCICLSFTRNLMKDFPSRTTTLSKPPLIWCYCVLPSRQNCVRKT